MVDTFLFTEAMHVAVLRRVRLIRPADRHEAARRCLILLALAWFPMALLVSCEPGAAPLFFHDITVQARFLVAMPLLVLADYIVLPRLRSVGLYFLESSLLPPSMRGPYEALANATRRRSASVATSFALAAVVYACLIAMVLVLPPTVWARWQRNEDGGLFSLAGWWHLLVGLPILLGLILTWAWRWLLWLRLLFWLSRCGLVLEPSHPDRSAGLAFLAHSPRSFAPVALALAVVVAATLAHSLLLDGSTAIGHEATPLATALIVVIVLGSPPLLFVRVLLAARHLGEAAYGELCRKLGLVFAERWLSGAAKLDTSALEQPDFSAMVDLYGVSTNAFEMKLLLVDHPTLLSLALIAIVPFVPLWLAAVPFDTVVDHIVKMLV